MRGAWAASAAATISAIIRPPVGPNGITAERCCQGGGSDATRLLRDAAAPDYFLRLLPKLRGFDMLKVDPAMPDAEVTLEYLCDNIWIVGSPDTVARKLATLVELLGHPGAHHARRHGVHADAVAPELLGEHTHQHDHRRLARRVGAEVRVRVAAGHRSGDHDRARRRGQRRMRGLGQQPRGARVDVEERVPVLDAVR